MALNAKAMQAVVQSLEARRYTANRPHNDLGPNLNIAAWVMTGAAAVFLGLRLYCKRIRQNKLWWDDYVLIAAFVRSIFRHNS